MKNSETRDSNHYHFVSDKALPIVVLGLSKKMQWQINSNEDNFAGKVDNRKLSIYKRSDFLGNAFKPVFVGKLFEQDGKTRLVGSFRMFWLGRLASSVWFLSVGFIFTVILISELISKDPEIWNTTLVGILFVSGALLIIRLGMWLSRKDKNCILDLIRREFRN